MAAVRGQAGNENGSVARPMVLFYMLVLFAEFVFLRLTNVQQRGRRALQHRNNVTQSYGWKEIAYIKGHDVFLAHMLQSVTEDGCGVCGATSVYVIWQLLAEPVERQLQDETLEPAQWRYRNVKKARPTGGFLHASLRVKGTPPTVWSTDAAVRAPEVARAFPCLAASVRLVKVRWPKGHGVK